LVLWLYKNIASVRPNIIKNPSIHFIKRSAKIKKDKYGHYAQIVWAETTHIGCAAIQINTPDRVKVNMLCNYGPCGNQGFQPVYIEGEAGTKCPEGSAANSETGLCVLQA